jgi:hypothetical protein
MWSHPVNFYWPLFGAHFPREHLGLWWHALGRPVEILEELVGLGLLVYLGIGHDLQDPAHRRAFLKTGKLQGANPAR